MRDLVVRLSAVRTQVLVGYARHVVLLVLALVAAGCVGEEQEQQLGDAIARDINTHIPLVADPASVLYINRIGLALGQRSERPEVPYRFSIVNSATVNAFALPGGHIYITRGLIERTENASELAGVLAHEVGHVAARHGAQALERELRTGSVVSELYRLFLLREPAILEQRALRLGERFWFASHSRAAEREADRLAVRYMMRAGMDPKGMITMLTGLIEEEAELPQPVVEWFSTHPATEERVRMLRRRVTRVEAEVTPELKSDLEGYSAFLGRLSSLPPPLDLHLP